MLMHSCRCILFIVVTGFYPNAKRFKNHLKMELENQFEKKRKFSFVSLSLPHFRPVGPFSPLGPLVLPHSLLGRPSSSGQPLPRLPFSPPRLTARAQLLASPPSSRHSRTARLSRSRSQPPRTHAPGRGSALPRSPGSLKVTRTRCCSYCCSPLHFHSRNRTYRVAAIHRRSRPSHRVGHHPRAASAPLFSLGELAFIPAFSPCLYLLQSWPLEIVSRAPASSSPPAMAAITLVAFPDRANGMVEVAIASASSRCLWFGKPWPVAPE
jgi:hypothetical protein